MGVEFVTWVAQATLVVPVKMGLSGYTLFGSRRRERIALQKVGLLAVST